MRPLDVTRRTAVVLRRRLVAAPRSHRTMPSFSLQSIYFGAAILGSVLLVIQVALALLGGDSDVDAEFDADLDVEGVGHLSPA